MNTCRVFTVPSERSSSPASCSRSSLSPMCVESSCTRVAALGSPPNSSKARREIVPAVREGGAQRRGSSLRRTWRWSRRRNSAASSALSLRRHGQCVRVCVEGGNCGDRQFAGMPQALAGLARLTFRVEGWCAEHTRQERIFFRRRVLASFAVSSHSEETFRMADDEVRFESGNRRPQSLDSKSRSHQKRLCGTGPTPILGT